jgi:RHS repeat-associated protein
VTDTQGTVHKLLNSSGTEVASYTYSPFGERLTSTSLTSPPGTLPYMPLGYGGTYSDPDIELLYAKSRYFDPYTTRFTTKDSYRGSKTSIISQNRYIYCHQNPVKYADPAGYAPIEGDHADPCTQTDMDMHYEPSDEELLPPELNSATQAKGKPRGGTLIDGGDGKTYWIPDGFSPNLDENGNPTGSFCINIGNNKIEVFIRPTGNGKFVVEKFVGTSEGVNSYNIAAGLNNALREVPGLGEFIADDVGAFASVITDFYHKNFGDWEKTYGKGTPGMRVMTFFFSAGVGYAIAKTLEPLMKISGGNGSLWNNLKKAGIDPFNFAMTHGFWNTFHNHKIKNGLFRLDLNFQGGGFGGGIGTVAGIVELSQATMALHFILSGGFGTPLSEFISNKDTEGLSSILSWTLGVASIFLGGAPAIGAGVASALLGILSGTTKNDDGTGWLNNAGITGDMKGVLHDFGLKNDWWGYAYDIQKQFISSGMLSHYFSIQLNKYPAGLGTVLGDIVWSLNSYIQGSCVNFDWDDNYGLQHDLYDLLIDGSAGMTIGEFYDRYKMTEYEYYVDVWLDERHGNP